MATREETKAFLDLSKKEQARLIEAARKVHINTGHRPPAALAKLLRSKGAPLASRAAMEQLRCSSCVERGRPDPSPVATLSTPSIPFHTLGIDIKEATHKGKKYKYLVLVDEATRLTRCILLFTTGDKEHRNATSEEILKAFELHWEELFGSPKTLHHDPEGALVSNSTMQEFALKGVKLEATAGESHWQLGIVERMIANLQQRRENRK